MRGTLNPLAACGPPQTLHVAHCANRQLIASPGRNEADGTVIPRHTIQQILASWLGLAT